MMRRRPGTPRCYDLTLAAPALSPIPRKRPSPLPPLGGGLGRGRHPPTHPHQTIPFPPTHFQGILPPMDRNQKDWTRTPRLKQGFGWIGRTISGTATYAFHALLTGSRLEGANLGGTVQSPPMRNI